MSRSAAKISRGWGVTAALGWLAFLVLAWWMQQLQPVTALDRVGTALALAGRSSAATVAADVITRLGSFPVVDVLAAGGAFLLWWRTRRFLLSAALLITVVETGAIVFFAKQLVARPRPPVAGLLGAPALDGSFPSGHTTSGAVVWVLGALFLASTVTTRWARTTVVLAGVGIAAAIGATRVYLGYHWSTDVLGGWLLAVAICATAIVFVDRVSAAQQPDRLRTLRPRGPEQESAARGSRGRPAWVTVRWAGRRVGGTSVCRPRPAGEPSGIITSDDPARTASLTTQELLPP